MGEWWPELGRLTKQALVDDAKHVEACDLARVIRGLPQGVREVRGHRDHSVLRVLAEVLVRRPPPIVLLHRRVLGTAAEETLDVEERHDGLMVA